MLSNLSISSVPDEDYSRHASCALNLISTFLIKYHPYYQEEFANTKGAIIIRISKKNRRYNGQKKKYKRTNNDQQNIHRVTRTPLKTGGELRFSGRVGSSCLTSNTRCVNLVTNPVISHEVFYDKWNISVVICDIDIP